MAKPLAAGAVHKGSTNECFRPTKLFIGGITRNTTTKQLRDHFSTYGRVLDCVAMRQPDGRPRGFGYVTLDSPQAADRCFASPQIVDGRVVDLKRAVPEGDMDSAPTTRLHTPGKASVVPHAAVCWPPHWSCARPIHAVVPDCMELLSISCGGTPSGLLSTSGTPTGILSTTRTPSGLLSTRPSQFPHWQDPGLPETPTGGTLSASAAEFVPVASTALEVPEQVPEDKPAVRERSVLGDITNKQLGTAAEKTVAKTLDAGDQAKEPMFVKQPKDARSFRQAPNLQIDTHDIYQDGISEGLLSPPGLEFPRATSSAQETEDEEDEDEDEEEEEEEEEDKEGEDDSEGEENNDSANRPLPSIGSADHASGNCKRCNFFPKGRCQNGLNCTFCHLPHDKRKPSRQEKRERKAQLHGEGDALIGGHVNPAALEDDEVQRIMAYPMFPGMPAMQTTKLPTPLALPNNVIPCFGSSPVAPPPGLSQNHFAFATQPATVHWQPDEEVSPVKAATPTQWTSAYSKSLLSTVPLSPAAPACAAAAQPAQQVQQTEDQLVQAQPKKVMVTMATQTEQS
eukprot:TRINITY_DN1475_c2_g1_i1.p1 TRINITY_DN1475_c2_g1~~TRINITY_DN1475_c2_g1_i1.p1  ORF type:complete len:568 (+),score=108.37 TRINITY_DN1475_c2_g1_i1:57-1760(+)